MHRRHVPVLVRMLMVISVVAVGAGCAAGQSPPASPSASAIVQLPNLAGTTWRAIEVGGRVPVPGQEPTITFGPDTIEGTDGCNSYGAKGGIRDGRLVVEDRFSTLIGCEARINDVARQFAAIVATGSTLAVDEAGRMRISGPAGSVVLVQVAVVP